MSGAKLSFLKNSIVRFTLFSILTILIFVVLLHFIDLKVVLKTLSSSEPLYLFYAFLIMLTFPTSIAWRWKYLLQIMGYKVSYWECQRIVLGTWPIMSITPLKSGDLLKGIYLRDKIPVVVGTGSIATEKMLDLSSLILFSIVGSLLIQEKQTLLISVSIMFLLVLGFLAIRFINFPFSQKAKAKFDAFFSSLETLIRLPGKFIFIFVFTLVKWLFVFWMVGICFSAFGIHIPLTYVVTALPIAIFIGLLPISISGMGTRDAAIIYLFSRYAPPDICLSVGILYAFFGYWFLSIIGLPFIKTSSNS